MRAVDHQFQLNRIDNDGRSIARQHRLTEWLHRGSILVLSIAAVLVGVSAAELLHDPTPIGASCLIGELIVIAIDLILHQIGYYLKREVDSRTALLRYELEVKGDELRQLALTLGLDLQRYLVP